MGTKMQPNMRNLDKKSLENAYRLFETELARNGY